MTNEQVNNTFNDMINRQVDLRVSHRLAGLMDLTSELEPWPDDEAPKLVGLLWM